MAFKSYVLREHVILHTSPDYIGCTTMLSEREFLTPTSMDLFLALEEFQRHPVHVKTAVITRTCKQPATSSGKRLPEEVWDHILSLVCKTNVYRIQEKLSCALHDVEDFDCSIVRGYIDVISSRQKIRYAYPNSFHVPINPCLIKLRPSDHWSS